MKPEHPLAKRNVAPLHDAVDGHGELFAAGVALVNVGPGAFTRKLGHFGGSAVGTDRPVRSANLFEVLAGVGFSQSGDFWQIHRNPLSVLQRTLSNRNGVALQSG